MEAVGLPYKKPGVAAALAGTTSTMGFVMPHVSANDCQALLSFSLMALRHLCSKYYFVTDLLSLPGSFHVGTR